MSGTELGAKIESESAGAGVTAKTTGAVVTATSFGTEVRASVGVEVMSATDESIIFEGLDNTRLIIFIVSGPQEVFACEALVLERTSIFS